MMAEAVADGNSADDATPAKASKEPPSADQKVGKLSSFDDQDQEMECLKSLLSHQAL